jgi:hypothetical protein
MSCTEDAKTQDSITSATKPQVPLVIRYIEGKAGARVAVQTKRLPTLKRHSHHIAVWVSIDENYGSFRH